LTCTLNISSTNFVEIDEKLEISIPYFRCKRNHKTITFKDINKRGICTPKNKYEGLLVGQGQLTNQRKMTDANTVISKLLEKH